MGWVQILPILGLFLTSSLASNPSQFPGSQAFEVEYLHSIRTGYTCEGEDLEVRCEAGQTIQIVRANYGRFSIALCNEDGQTHWSVNCMAPNTRQILQKKCDGLPYCQVPVSSDLFNDPCPGTRKYLEIHYVCSALQPNTPLPPPWADDSASTSRSDQWLQKQHKEKDIKPPVNTNRHYNSRIPILVATTTAAPKRIPITTPQPTTTTTTTTTSSTTSTSATDAASDDIEEDNDMDNTIEAVNEELWPVAGGLDSSLGDIEVPPGMLSEYCPSTVARNLVWKYTKRGAEVVQPCPNGATGLARWRCEDPTGFGPAAAAGPAAHWAAPQPDMSDCKSAAITNLEVKLRQADPENVIASSLAHLTGSRRLYGGDLESAAEVMKTVANKIQYLLQQKTDKFYKKEAYIQEILLNIVRSGSNLLDAKNKEAWADISGLRRMKVAGALLQAMQDNARIFAAVTNQPEVLMESSYNILMSISVLTGRAVRNGTRFPSNPYEEPFGTIEDSILLPPTSGSRGLVKLLFFSFKHLDEILAQYFRESYSNNNNINNIVQYPRVINSRIISAAVEGRSASLPDRVLVSLKHIVEAGMGRPACVSFDPEENAWTERWCRVVATNASRTVCECSELSSYALLMAEEAVTTAVQLPSFHVEIIAASVAAAVILIAIIIALKWRTEVHKVLLSPCSKKEKGGGLDPLKAGMDKSQSFFTGLNIMTQDKSQTMTTTVQEPARLSQYMLASGTLPPTTTFSTSSQYEGFDNHPTHTLPAAVRAPYPIPSTHITLNPNSSQLVDNINRMMAASNSSSHHVYQSTAAPGHIYQVAMSPQLSQLTNTLRKKKCPGGHPGPCHHRNHHHDTTDSSVRSDSVATTNNGGEMETETTEMVPPPAAEVVFRAVSPHGHVYWEIDPKRPGRVVEQSDSDTNNDMHNMSDFSEEDGKVLSDRSRQSSSRFSDNRPLIPATMGLTPLPENQASPPSLIQFSPAHRGGFSSLQRPQDNNNSNNLGTFSTRTRLRQQAAAGRIKGSMEAIADEEHTMVPEQVQQQVQIPDLRRIPVSVKSSEYIMAKIQSHMDHQRKQGSGGGANGNVQNVREREV